MIQTTMALIITEPQSITNTFKPFKYPSNDLLVSKVVEHPFGDSYNIPEDLAFDFEINFGTDYANYTFDTTAGEKTTDENGIMRVKLKPGETMYFEPAKIAIRAVSLSKTVPAPINISSLNSLTNVLMTSSAFGTVNVNSIA